MHTLDCSLAGIKGDFVVGLPCVEMIEAELEVAVVWVDNVDGSSKVESSTYFHRAPVIVIVSLMKIRTQNGPILVP